MIKLILFSIFFGMYPNTAIADEYPTDSNTYDVGGEFVPSDIVPAEPAVFEPDGIDCDCGDELEFDDIYGYQTIARRPPKPVYRGCNDSKLHSDCLLSGVNQDGLRYKKQWRHTTVFLM